LIQSGSHRRTALSRRPTSAHTRLVRSSSVYTRDSAAVLGDRRHHSPRTDIHAHNAGLTNTLNIGTMHEPNIPPKAPKEGERSPKFPSTTRSEETREHITVDNSRKQKIRDFILENQPLLRSIQAADSCDPTPESQAKADRIMKRIRRDHPELWRKQPN
jgi:hypothetical protein